jgi:predicted DNA-binding transcriptional regulator AlpA
MNTQTLSVDDAASLSDLPDRIDSPKQTAALIGVSVTTLWRMRQRHEFPEPIRISPNRCGWLRSTTRRWIADRLTRADRKPSPAAGRRRR